LVKKIIGQKIPYGISIYTYTEILQGAKNEKEFKILEDYFSSFTILLSLFIIFSIKPMLTKRRQNCILI